MAAVSDLSVFGIKARNLKCFEDWQGLDSIYPINLIVGRNNSGKSTLLDLVWHVTKGLGDELHYSRKGKPIEVAISYQVTKEMVEDAFRGIQMFSYGQDTLPQARIRCVGLHLTTIITSSRSPTFEVRRGGDTVTDQTVISFANHLRAKVGDPLRQLLPIRLRADRDIRAEGPGGSDQVGEHGENATQLVERYLHETRDHGLVEENLLADLNAIIEPDWSFSRIFPKRVGGSNGPWELNLEDASGTLVPLSHTGSGVKTLLLVLINLHLVPHAKRQTDLSRFIFCFEEVENNLHPAAQRRLFRYLRDKAVKEKCTFFLTTHSNTVIDIFSKDDQAQLLHVAHDGDKATVQPVTCHLRRCGVLADLDVRASDLLQSNVIVWVEGPSDRLYFNRWVELWSEGALQEHVHFQCLWYGGSPLADMTFEADVPDDDLVSALRVNRNAIVLMDSDRRGPNDALKKRVQRVSEEAGRSGAFAWVTAGREVENYIPMEPLRSALNKADLDTPPQYADVYDHIGRSRNKVGLARLVTPYITRDTLETTHDLGQQLDRVCRLIRQWNGMLSKTATG
jgi:hypothetical protein